MSALSEWDVATTRDIVEHLVGLMRAVTTHGAWNDATSQAATAAAEAVNAGGPPFALQFVAGAVFRDRQIVALSPTYAARAHELARALGNLDAHELLVERNLDAEGASKLGALLAMGLTGNGKAADLQVPGLRVRSLAHPEDRDGDGWIDAAVFAAQQVHTVLERAHAIDPDPAQPWPWSEGRSVITALERAVDAEPRVTDRVFELSPGYWSVVRRAASAAALTIHLCRALALSERTTRAVAHATLAMGLQGYDEYDGASLLDTARVLYRRMLAAPAEAVTGIDPHRLRTTGILHLLADPETATEVQSPVPGLVHMAYHLERVRCPGQLRLELTRGDLWAYAYGNAGRNFDPAWVRMLVTAFGPLPVGTLVRAPDGAVGPVVGPGAARDPWRPKMFAAGKCFVPDGPVALVPPAER